MSLRESAESGDRLAALRDLRDLLAGHIQDADSLRDIASLSARLTDVLAQIEALAPPAKTEGDPIDEIAARRTSRGSSTAAS